MHREFRWPDLPRALHEQQPWGRPGIEPPLGEVLADPIVQAFMRRDGISLAALQSIIGHVFAWVHPGLRSSSSSPSAPRPEKDGWSPAPSPRGRGSSLPPEVRAEAAGLYSLSRNISSSVGISVVNSLLTQNTQVNHADIVQYVIGVNRLFESPSIAQFWNPATDAGRAALDAMITQQAQIIAYIDDYTLLMIATLAAIPLLLVFSKPPRGGTTDHAVAME